MDSASSRSVSWSTLRTLYRSASHVSTPEAWDDVGRLTMNVPWHTSSSGMPGADDVEYTRTMSSRPPGHGPLSDMLPDAFRVDSMFSSTLHSVTPSTSPTSPKSGQETSA